MSGIPDDEACADACLEHLERAIRDDSPAEVDLAVAAGERAADQAGTYVRYALAWAYGARWDHGGDPADRDRAIDHWQAVLAVTEEPGGLVECGRLLGERAEADDDITDVTAAIDLFERAAAAGAEPWWHLGTAYKLRWQLGQELADLEHAARHLDRGLAGPESDEWLVLAYYDRLALARELLNAGDAGDVQSLIADAHRVWAGGAGEPDDRARLALMLAATATLTWQAEPERADPAWLRRLTACGRTLSDRPPGWDQALTVLDALASYTEQARSGSRLPDDALDTLIAPLRDGSAEGWLTGDLHGMATMFVVARAIQTGDRRSLRTAIDRFRASADPEEWLFGDAVELIDRVQHGDPAARDEIAALLVRLRTEPLSYAARNSLTPLLSLIDAVMSGADGGYRPVDRTPIPAGDVAAADHGVRALAGPAMAARTRHDVATLRECADRADELLAELPAGHIARLIALGLVCLVGEGLLTDEPGDQDAARRMLRWTAEGLGITAGPHHPRWTSFALARGEALRHLDGGDRAESRRWGLAGLAGHAWQVLLQSGTDDAVLVAAAAGAAARRVAGWSQADGALDDLVAALDAGRGLVLYAATASRTVAERLTEAGHPELAEQWRQSAGYGRDAVTGDPLGPAGGRDAVTGDPLGPAGGRELEVPDDLRARVLRVLDLRTPATVSTADIRAGLAATGAEALVYLVPSSEEQPGAAVIVPVAGEPALLTLPGLITGPGSRLARTAAGVRDAGPVDQPGGGEPGRDEPGGGPDELCAWAWTAAMGPLLRRGGLRRPGSVSKWETGLGVASTPTQTLVLVPTGPLSSVPWHAAFHTAGDRRRYAVEEAVISYAVSGRAFVESAREPTRTVKSVLIVGDPTGDLPFAGLEARAIGAAFHPDAAYVGTPRQVLDWVDAAAPGPSLLHLACHGHADPKRPADACLRLAGGDLTARQLLAASRTAELEIEQVFLAACTTGRTGIDHDEAFSLTTAFLAAGARTAFGSLWPVPDEETSMLMYVVHHHLAAGCAPADALHRAQLWMLNPDRRPPAGMPDELARHSAGPRPAEPRCWAAFTHQGR